jgi:hypothetical protein
LREDHRKSSLLGFGQPHAPSTRLPAVDER